MANTQTSLIQQDIFKNSQLNTLQKYIFTSFKIFHF